MALDRPTLGEELLELDSETERQLKDVADRLSPHRARLGKVWAVTFQRAAGKTATVSPSLAVEITGELLDLFFDHIPRRDFEGYYLAIVAKGKAYQAGQVPYGRLMLAIHHFEQVMLPFLTEAYPNHEDLEHAIVAVDRLSDNAIVLLASSYFDQTLGELRALQQVTDTALSTLDLDRLLSSLLVRIVEAIGADVGAVALRDEVTGKLHFRAYHGVPADQSSLPVLDPREGLAARSINTGAVVQVSDAQADPLVVDGYLKRAGARALVAVPLKLAQRVIGAISFGRLIKVPFAAREIELVELLAERAAAAIEHSQLYERTVRLLRETAALQRITTSITGKMALPQVLDVVADGVAEVFGADRVVIFLWEQQRNEIHCRAARGVSDAFVAAVRDRWQFAMSHVTMERGRFYSMDVRIDPTLDALRPEIDREGFRTLLVLPFGHGAESVGAICLCHDEVRRYEDEEGALAQVFADQAAIAIANATLYQQLQQRAAELDRANSDLQILDRMKADFLAMVSHELRTPLTAILGYADLLLRGARGELGERPEADIGVIRSNGQRLLTLINDLIDFSSIGAGQVPIASDRVQLSRVVPHVLRALSSQAEARQIQLHADLARHLPPMAGDSTAVEKILKQLLSNALKFTPPGGNVTVRVAETDELLALTSHSVVAPGCRIPPPSQAGRRIVVSVSDDGIGIPPEQLSRVWDHFYQVDSSSSRRFGGTGLGLAIVKRLVELQGGCVWASSAGIPGQGAIFAFSMPVAPGPGVT